MLRPPRNPATGHKFIGEAQQHKLRPGVLQ